MALLVLMETVCHRSKMKCLIPAAAPAYRATN